MWRIERDEVAFQSMEAASVNFINRISSKPFKTRKLT